MPQLNQPFNDALGIIIAIEVNPDHVHPLQWGRLWANLIMIRNRPHTDEEWQQLMLYLAWPEKNPCPEAFPPDGHHLVLTEAVIEEIYQAC